ncbi:Eco57I restriction-modification methylase domain-containing protein [Paenarthrobacter ureafaciens]|uniref:Eco57I restriction-modification methylase domain-containing protein n=1 Tax=Paenarthrobacter ureafaciens TaxID=37931 RepID=UPI001FB2BD35|nr:N-6 DNA methylase [Paenarthrobacter ureafaciens]UOD83475.1 N-6 DNA methylase [Paenarthrobacter ureafaciens]
MTPPKLTAPDWVAYSSPSHNNPLVPRVERLGRIVRAAAADIETVISVPFRDLYAPSRTGLGFTLDTSDESRRAAWALIGEWLVAASVGASCVAEGLGSVHNWFWSGSDRELGTVPELAIALDSDNAVELRALMPYLLDPMAAATRRDLLRAQSTAEERRARKASGVYYTPGDVAQLMVERVLSAGESTRQHLWLDPAHGSGVFLRAVLSAISGQPRARDRIYGVDLDPFAAESASFVLTAEDLVLNPEGPAPWDRWHRFRRNFATGDGLLIDTTLTPTQPTFDFDQQPNRPQDGHPLGSSGPWRLESAFPEIAGNGFSRVVANPPYAALQPADVNFHIPYLHPVTGLGAKQDISAVFAELCSNLLPSDGAMAIVLPLSVVSSTRAPFPELREHLSKQPGWLELLSFDRVPDALFGDDIKTRNAIVHLDKAASARFTVSPLYRWTSRTRQAALGNIPVTSVDGLDGVPQTIPKIGFDWERELFTACASQPRRLDNWQTRRQLLPLERATSVILDDSDVLALAPTAYNFLGVVREPYRAVTEGHDSQSSFSILRFDSDLHASAAYALLSSRLAFWIWHVTGDGFHVTNALHRRIPAPNGDTVRLGRLAELGDKLWKAALPSPVVSTNRGSTTVAFPTWTHTDLIDEIDSEVGASIGVDYAARLAAWHKQLVVVDLDSERRNMIGKKTS